MSGPKLTSVVFGCSLLLILLGQMLRSGQFFPYDKRAESKRKDWYPEHLRAMGEPSLYERRSQLGTEFRFLHLPSFHNPSAIRITRTATGTDLHVVRLTGAGGSEPGKIELNRSHPLSEQQWQRFSALLEKASFWNLPEEEEFQSGCDGSRWILEGRSGRRYHMVDRWSPRGDAARNLAAFVACCMYLRELAELPKDETLY